MCKTTTTSTTTSTIPPVASSYGSKPLRLLLSLESYQGESSGQGPDGASALLTGLVFILFLVTSEQLCQQWLYNHQDWHPILEDDLHRLILARHVGVDTLACTICICLGVAKCGMYRDLWNHYVRRSGGNNKDKQAFPRANYLNRILAYDPACYRICLFFAAYQIKNLYDTIIFNDGAVFIFHHVFSAITAYGCMVPKINNYYPFFFVGLSEVSTAILCLLANFDPTHGVAGLDQVLPVTKVVLAAIFVVTFLLCRIITWPIFSYHFFDDIFLALKNEANDPRIAARKGWYIFHLVSNASLTLLQFAWLVEIGLTAHKEMVAMGVL